MDCSGDWTIKFIGDDAEVDNPVVGSSKEYDDKVFLELRPISLNLKLTRAGYDFARAKFPVEVANHIEAETESKDGGLYGLTVVALCYKGNVVKQLLFRPDFVTYDSDHTRMEFHDLHYTLESGSVNLSEEAITIYGAYSRVVEAASTDIIPPLEIEKNFQLPDNIPRIAWGSDIPPVSFTGEGNTRSEEYEELLNRGEYPPGYFREKDNESGPDFERNDTHLFVDSDNAVDFDGMTPQKAIEYLNQTFKVRTWVNREGELIVGLPEANDITHIASKRDSRVLRYKDPTISHAKEPIHAAYVEGPWADEAGIKDFGDLVDGLIVDPTEPIPDPDWDHSIKLYGVAERTDVDYGKQFITKTDASEDNLRAVARLALEQKMKNVHSGSVEIDPRLSGTSRTNVLDLRPGDKLNLVPNDKYFNNPDADSGNVNDKPPQDEICGNFVSNETYLVNEVEHNFKKNSSWFVNADVAIFPDIEINTSVIVYNEEEREILNKDELDDSFSKFEEVLKET